MIMSSLIGLLCGLGVGCRFKVLALIPAHGVALMAVSLAMQVGHVGLVQACSAFCLWNLCLQAGYAVAVGLSVPRLQAPRHAGRN